MISWTHQLGEEGAKVAFSYTDILDPICCAEIGIDPIKETKECIELEYLEALARKHGMFLFKEDEIKWYVDNSEGPVKEDWQTIYDFKISYESSIREISK